MKTAILVFVAAGLLITAAAVVAQMPSSVSQDPLQGAPSVVPIGHCQEIAAHDASKLLLSRLCESSQTYLQKLPDFICQQTTTEKREPFAAILNSQVTFLKGEEIYSHVTLNGTPMNDADPDASSLMAFRSDGEFGLFLANLFKRPMAARFKSGKSSQFNGSAVTIYEFNVPAESSFWSVRDSKGRVATPGFQGQLWLDRGTGRLLKLKLQSADLPPGMDVTWLRTSIDYAPTSLGDAGVFVLPVRSESTVCGWWGNSGCPKHVMTFHDCQKFAATTRIIAEAPEQ